MSFANKSLNFAEGFVIFAYTLSIKWRNYVKHVGKFFSLLWANVFPISPGAGKLDIFITSCKTGLSS